MRTTIIAGVALALSATSACSALDRAGADDESLIRSGVAQLPQPEADAYTVRIVDLDAATEAAGLERPTDLEPESTGPWMARLGGVPQEGGSYAPVLALMPDVTNQHNPEVEEFDELAGWSVVDVSSYAEIIDPSHPFATLSGDVDESTLEHLPEVADGVRTVGEGEDGESDITKTNAVQPVGRPVRMAEQDGRLAVSSSTDAVQEWLAGPEETLADDPTAASLAEALDDEDVIAAEIVIGEDFTGSTVAGRPQVDGAVSLPEGPFDAVAVGWKAPDGEPQVIIAYHFADEDAATAAVDPLEEAFASGTRLDGTPVSTDVEVAEITAEGPVVTATVEPQRDRSHIDIRTALHQRDAPFVHE